MIKFFSLSYFLYMITLKGYFIYLFIIYSYHYIIVISLLFQLQEVSGLGPLQSIVGTIFF